MEEDVAVSVLTERRYDTISQHGELLDDKLVRDGGHDTGTISISRVGTDSTSVREIA